MPVTLTLVDDKTRAQAIRAIERAAPRTRITISDPALTDGQLTLLRVLAADLMPIMPGLPMRDWELLLTGAMFRDQCSSVVEDGAVVVNGCRFEELTVAQASEMADFVYMFGAQRGVVFRENRA